MDFEGISGGGNLRGFDLFGKRNRFPGERSPLIDHIDFHRFLDGCIMYEGQKLLTDLLTGCKIVSRLNFRKSLNSKGGNA